MAWSKVSASDRGYGARWQRIRDRVLAETLGLCASCARQGRTTAAECVDHVRPKSQGGDDSRPNLQPLCGPCHLAKTHMEECRRLRPTIGLDGWPIAEVPVYSGPLWRNGNRVQ